MELKDYQRKTLDEIKRYLSLLDKWRKKSLENPEIPIDFPAIAWEKALIGRPYVSRKNGLKKPLPNFCLKIPTGGGKTLLAVKAIDLINTDYRKKQTGLVLWIVPTHQIYSQTIKNLRNREHPYRQHLDIASGGHTLILEKTEQFTPQDLEESLVIMMLMLPSASRQNKETLRMFRDSGGFQSFFPDEDNIEAHKELKEKIPNLDCFGTKDGFWGCQVKTSLGNTLRLIQPVIILDEGHKAYSEIAQETLRGFNPSMILELSATPPKGSNILMDIRGRELNKEEMIKLDLHLTNKASPDWKDTMLAAVEKRNLLEEKAKEYDSNTGIYIRPICLVQVERTGKEQRDGKHIHSEDVREYLIKIAGITPDEVKVTSAELKEIEGIDLYSRTCPVRYIITRYALQEGWDCAFAYLLAVLTNPNSQVSLTQLIGRILRQPFARKTKVKELDESYVFTFQQRAGEIIEDIKRGFEQEGLGDLSSHISWGGEVDEQAMIKESTIRPEFLDFAKQFVLPVFVVKDGKDFRPVSYEMDIASRIDWEKADISPIDKINLSFMEEIDGESVIGMDDKEVIKKKSFLKKEGGLKLDPVFLARHLIDVVPNPWVAYEFGEKALKLISVKYPDQKLVENNFVFIIEELRKVLAAEKERMSKDVFDELLAKDILRLMVIGKEIGFRFKSKRTVRTARQLTKSDGRPLQRSLFDVDPEEDLNEDEKKIAWYLDDQNQLFFWYRNISRSDYAVQGWKKQKIYPDFLFAKVSGEKKAKSHKVFVVETKGIHLKNEDTDYKRSVFDVCNELAQKKDWNELALALKDMSLTFEVIFHDDWRNKLNELLNA